MKAKKNKRGIFGTAMTVLLVCTLLIGGFWNFSTPTSAAETAPSTLEYVENGFYFDMTQAITSPEMITTDRGYYYRPTAYVYFGSVYNDATGKYEPILCRVLDKDADNTGEGGAMFVLTENAVRANDRFAYQSFNEYFDYENIYTDSFINKYPDVASLFEGAEHIRAVTKTDVLANMSGAFGYIPEYGYEWETDVYDADNDKAVPAEQATLLVGSKIFPLSVEELLRYVANYNGAPGMETTHISNKASVTWWLRTGLNDSYGNLVGAVDESGKVVPVSADDRTVAGRYGFNIETDDISYIQRVGNNVYRLAFNAPEYKNADPSFSAEVADVKGNTVTIKYSGYIPNAYFNDKATSYISVIIKDETNAVKYYGSIATVPEASNSDTITGSEYTASFVLPDGLEEGDVVSVFWEKKYDKGESISYTSNMVDLPCIHNKQITATCVNLAVCGKCNTEFGFFDREKHANVGNEFYYDDETDTHWNVCADCEGQTNVEPCAFGLTCKSFCECGNIDVAYDMHHFDENGVCESDPSHFENPVIISKGILSDFEIYNEGQFIAFAKHVNSLTENGGYNEDGEYWGYPSIVSLKADLDFKDVEGFVPIGTEESPFDALHFDGEGHTVIKINYNSDGSYIGLFGVVENTDIENIKLASCSFSGASVVGALIGKATNVRASYITVDGVELVATDGSAGAVMAISDENSEIYYSISYEVHNGDNSNVLFTSDDNALIRNSYCLAEEYDLENGKMTRDQFDAGEVGYLFSQIHSPKFGKYGGQEIGVDKYPYFGGKIVYMAHTCDGATVYFNDASLKAQIEAHNYTAFAEEEPTFIWEPKMGTHTYNCFVSAVCGECGCTGLTEAEVVIDESRVPVRTDWTATITLGGVTKTANRTSIGILIQDMIGMTNIVKDFDGATVYPEYMMTNHRLETSPPARKEYEVFFVNPETGERYAETSFDWYGKPYQSPIGVTAAGTYDLLVIGKNDYEGQEYTYEGALVINPITVTVSPLDVYKHYDGNTRFEASYTLDSEGAGYDWFEIVLGNSASAEVGEYTLGVSIKYNGRAYDYEIYRSSVTLVLERDTVSAVILPALYQSIENKNYPTEFTYGDTIPTPTPDNFKVTGSGELSFEWYSAEYDYYGDELLRITKIGGVPSDAGDYILRVRAEASDGLLSAYADFKIRIDRRWLWVEVSVPESTKTVSIKKSEYHTSYYYVVESLDEVAAVIVDEGKQIHELDGVELYYRFNYQGIADGSTERCYYVEYCPILADSGVSPYNYKIVSSGIYLAFPSDEDSSSRDITMWVKECNVDLSSPDVEFDIRNVVMKAGEVFLLGHTLSEVKLVIDRDKGEIRVAEFKVVDTLGNDVSSLYRPSTEISDWSHTAGGNNVVHIFDNPCDTDCNVEYCAFVRSAYHTGGVATCTTPAICTACGEVYGEVNEYNHTLDDVVVIPNTEDLLTHLVLYSCCGVVAEVSEHTAITPATCTERAICSVCNWTYGELDLTNHSSDDSTYTLDPQNTNNHLQTHVCCGMFESKAHTGGEATCIALAACEYCKSPYGELAPDNHAQPPVILSHESDASLHNISYACCGFAISEAHSGGEATCIAVKICEKCDTGYGEKNFENHVSDDITYLIREDNSSMHDIYHSCCHEYIDKEYHTGGVATCKSGALCEYCGTPYGDIDPENHATDEYSYEQSPSDAGKHTKAHACCGEEISNEVHSGGEANCLYGKLCEYCGVYYGEKTDHVYDNGCDAICNVCGELTRALSFHTNDDGDGSCDVCATAIPKEGLSGGAISAIATSSTVVAGLGGFSLFWFVIKKKSWSALLKLLLG